MTAKKLFNPERLISATFLFVLAVALTGFSNYLQNKSFFNVWNIWSDLYVKHGLVLGYYATNDVYPPGFFSLLALLKSASLHFGSDFRILFKLAQIAFFLLGGVIINAFAPAQTRKEILILYGVFLFPNSIIFESGDVFFTPFILCALFLFLRKQDYLAALCFSCGILIKWQAIVFLPLFLIWYLLAGPISIVRRLRNILSLSVCFAIPFAFVALVFGFNFVYTLFRPMGASTFFSGNALNLNYLIGEIYYLLAGKISLSQLQSAAALPLDPPDFLWFSNLPAYLPKLSKLFFAGVFVFLIVIFVTRAKKRWHVLYFSYLVGLCYFELNTEVHENHLHFVVLPLVILACELPKALRYHGYLLSANLLLLLSPLTAGIWFLNIPTVLSLIGFLCFLYAIHIPFTKVWERDLDLFQPLGAIKSL